MEAFAQFLYVGFVEGALLVQDFGYDALGTEDGDQVFLPQIVGIHQRAKDGEEGAVRHGGRPTNEARRASARADR